MLIIVAVIAVAAVAIAGVQAVTSGWLGSTVGSLFSLCPERTALTVVADPTISPVVESVAAAFDKESGNCTVTEIRAQDSADTAALLASGAGGDVDAWIPDSTVWIERMQGTAVSLGRSAPDFVEGDSVATTPLVLAAPASRAADFAEEPPGWANLLGGTVGGLLPDPESFAASLAGLAQVQSISSAEDPREFAAAMIELGKTIPASSEEAFDSASTATRPTVVVTTEHEVASFNATEPVEPLIAIYPSDGTVALTYPFVTLTGAPSTQPTSETDSASGSSSTATAALLDELAEVVRAASEELSVEGFRNSDGDGTLSITGVVAEATATDAAVEGAAQLEILRSWSVINLRSRLLVVIDVSGSMLDPASNGLRRIDVFQLAAGEAVTKFPGEAELGVWVFSQNRVGTQDWEDLSPIAPLSDPAHAKEINDIIVSLPSRVYGDTGLYDTVLAAVTTARESYDPSKVNSVILITDGKNDDDNGIDLSTLLASLEEQNDPDKPVGVIMIGFGPDTDVDAMTKIAQATGGGAYVATVPEDLGTVLVDALSQRGCRPDC